MEPTLIHQWHPIIRMSIRVLLIAISAVTLGCDDGSNSDPTPASAAAGAPASTQPAFCYLPSPADFRTVSITLPHDEPAFPEGPGRREFVTSCIVCHSPRYITMQPNFPAKTWEKEVHKMVTEYGAHVTPEQEKQIVNYIVTIRGAGVDAAADNAVHGGSAK